MTAVQWVGSPNFHPQNGVAKLFITDHWMVGTLRTTDSAFNGSRPASSTYGVGETEIHQYVNEKDYPFSDGNTYANQHTISIEHEGGWMQADGTRKSPSPAVLELSAQLHADIARRYGWGALAVGVNVFPHNHWVATACPGTLNIDWIVARANELLGNPGTVLAGINSGTASSSYGEAATVAEYQQLLNAHGAHLDVDGIKGPLTTAAVITFQRANGLAPDGLVGPLTIAKLRAGVGAPVAAVAVPGALLVDGDRGPLTIRAEQRALGVKDDAIFGPISIRAEQARVGVRVDSIRGPLTIKGVQRHVGATADGIEGPKTVKAEQIALNSGRF